MSRYKFLNVNPLGKKELDCVCRAISLATNDCYYDVERKLELVGELFNCPSLCVCCYKFLLDSVYGLDRIEEYQGLTIEEFMQILPKGTYIIRVHEHCTCVIDGVRYDIWYCMQEKLVIVWEVK